MKKGQILVLLILLIIMSVIIWIGACSKTTKERTPGKATTTPSGENISLNTPTPPASTEKPSDPDVTPEPQPVEFPDLNADDFKDISVKPVEWEAGFSKNTETGETGATYNKDLLDKYIKGYDYVFIKNDSTENKEIYLTYNISYDIEPVIKILDILKAHNDANSDKIYVTFFIHSGCFEWPEVLTRIMDEGHQLAIRAIESGAELSVKEIETGLKAVEAQYRKLFGNTKRMTFYRPGDEFSTREIAVANALGYKVVFFCFHYADWDTSVYTADGSGGKLNAGRVVLDNFHDGSVIQLTASQLNVDILEYLIAEGLGQGFTFERLDQ